MSTIVSFLKAIAVLLGLLKARHPEFDTDVIDEGIAPTNLYLD